MPWLIAPLAAYIVMGLMTAGAYARDKHAARLGRRRIPERSLHLLELCGGALGAVVARRTLRHKTRDTRFLLVSWAILALHAALWAVFFWWRVGAAS